jgi:hypothetical protein
LATMLAPKNNINTSQLVELEADVLQTWELAHGDIFLWLSENKLVRVKRAGDYLEESWKKKYTKSKKLLTMPLAREEILIDLITRFKNSKSQNHSSHDEQKELNFKNIILSSLHSDSKPSMIEFSFVFYELFKPDEKAVQLLQDSHIVLYRRAHLISSLSVIFAMSCGYDDADFLRDIYQMGWALDIGLSHKDFSYWVALACQAERINPGSGINFLQSKNASVAEIDLFLNHPQLSADRAPDFFELKFPGLLSALVRHHEKSDGSGFPYQIPFSLISDWEAILVLADQLIDYREDKIEFQLKANLIVLINELDKTDTNMLPVSRVLRKVKKWLSLPTIQEAIA